MDRPSSLPAEDTLHAERTGSGPRLAMIHGFTQTRRCWEPIAADLTRDHELVLVDAPGHGRSAGVEADLAGGVGEATYLGYSMGGRFALHTALQQPDQVRGLVLVGATAGLEDPAERAARVADDEARADRIEQIGVAAFLDEWLSLPIFAGLDEDSAHREARRENTARGLASSLRRAGTGTQQPTWDRLAELSMPVLVVAGADDAKFVAIGRRIAASIGPNANFAAVDGAGHTAHLEQPARFLAILRPWLAANGL